jgi:predicted metal-dependent phosphotriesterase family hydrolase
MGKVNTVLGPITTQALGITAMHEHIGFGLPGHELDPKWWTPQHIMLEAAIEKLGRFRELGGRTIVDCSGMGFGRDIAYYQVISRATGVNIIACTGFWAGDGVPQYFRDKSIEYLADLFIREITVGIDGTDVKAGAIKVGVSNGGLSELDERLYRAAARAARVTGAPILTHLSKDADRQMDLCELEGLSLDRIIIGHADHAFDCDPARDFRVAKRGAFVGFDTIGYDTEKAAPGNPAPPWSRPRAERLSQIVNFLEVKGANRAIISTDANCYPLGFESTPNSVTELLEVFVPDLRASGVTEETIEQLLVRNPAQLLSMA